jgi:hypothetical protein
MRNAVVIGRFVIAGSQGQLAFLQFGNSRFMSLFNGGGLNGKVQ